MNFDLNGSILQSALSEKPGLSFYSGEGLLFPALLEPEPQPEPQPQNLSCAELVATGEQDLLVNDWMATIIGQYVYKLLHRQPIYSFMTYINAESMAVRSLPICGKELDIYL